MSTAAKLFTISISANVSVAAFHFLPRLAAVTLKRLKERCGVAEQLLNLCDEKSWFVGKFLVDQLSSIILTIMAVVIIAVSGIITNPFGMPVVVQVAVAADVGHYAYKLAQDFLLREYIPSYRFDALHHLVAIMSLTVFLVFEENGLNSLLGLLFEGNLPFFGVSQLLKTLEVEDSSLLHGVNKYCGLISTIMFRCVIPLAFVIVSINFGNPFSMNYTVIAFYFLSSVFFLILNLWLTRISFLGVKKFKKERKRHICERALIGPRGASDDESQVGVDGATNMPDKSQVHNNLTYLTPCANTNINIEPADGRVTNINKRLEAVTNISETLFPTTLNNAADNRSPRTSVISSTDSAQSVFSFTLDSGIHSGTGGRSYYPENIRLGAIRPPPEGEDSNSSRQTIPSRPLMISGVPALLGRDRSFSDSSVSDKSSFKSEESFIFEGNNNIITHTRAVPPPPIPPPRSSRVVGEMKASQTSLATSSSMSTSPVQATVLAGSLRLPTSSNYEESSS